MDRPPNLAAGRPDDLAAGRRGDQPRARQRIETRSRLPARSLDPLRQLPRGDRHRRRRAAAAGSRQLHLGATPARIPGGLPAVPHGDPGRRRGHALAAPSRRPRCGPGPARVEGWGYQERRGPPPPPPPRPPPPSRGRASLTLRLRPPMLLAVEGADGLVGAAVFDLHEAETAGAPGFAVGDQAHRADAPELLEHLSHLVFGGAEWQVSDVDFLGHVSRLSDPRRCGSIGVVADTPALADRRLGAVFGRGTRSRLGKRGPVGTVIDP